MQNLPFPRNRNHHDQDDRAPVARLEGVTHYYGSTLALDGLDLEIGAGEVVALLGPNGAGKTTAVSLLLGLLRPTGGKAEIFGHPP